MFRQILDAHRTHLLTWLISANRDLDLYETAGYRVIADAAGSSAGPLSGIATAAAQAETPWLYVLAGDTPQLDPSILTLLAKHRRGHSALVARNDRTPSLSPAGQNGRCGKARGESAGGFLKPRGWLAAIGALSISVPPTSSFGTNINTPEDLAQWRALEENHETQNP